MTTAVATRSDGQMTRAADYAPIRALVLDTVSPRTRRDYGRALDEFLDFWVAAGKPQLSRALVQSHIAALKAAGVTDSSINQRLAAIRKLAIEAADNGLIDEATAQSIKRIKNIKRAGGSVGNWLTKAQAEQMLNAPDADTLIGKRDRAIIAVMLGCGLRRSEVATLTVEHIQQRDGRWVVVDLVGKRNRTRTVGVNSWVKVLLDNWTGAAGITRGYLFPPMRKGGNIQGGHMTSQAVWNVVQRYAPIENLAPHDMRRTYAKLAKRGGAPIEQIQFNLGHESVQTTERYIGDTLDLQHTPSDYIHLNISGD